MILDLVIGCLLLVLLLPHIKAYRTSPDDNITPMQSTCLKGLLCVCIFLNHFSGWFPTQGPVLYAFVHLGTQFVSVFFFLSAYGLSKKYGQQNLSFSFLWTHLIRLFVPYWLCEVVYALVSVLAKIPIHEPVTVKNIVLSAICRSEIVENSWFVPAIALMYVCFFIGTKIFPKIQNSIKLLVLLIVVFVLLGSGKWIMTAIAFPLGAVFAEKESAIRNFLQRHYLLKLIFTALLFGFVVSIKFIGQYLDRSILMDLSDTLCSVIVPIIVYQILMHIQIQNAVLKFLGKISYPVYLLHGLMIRISYHFFGLEKPLFFFLCAFGLIVASAFLMQQLSGFCLKGLSGKKKSTT